MNTDYINKMMKQRAADQRQNRTKETRERKMRPATYLIAVDPGVVTMGFAVFNAAEQVIIAKAKELTKNEKLNGGGLWHSNVETLMRWYKNELVRTNFFRNCVTTICEMPILFRGARGYAASAGGELTHMAYAVGRIAEFSRSEGQEFIPVNVNDWKGSLPQNVVRSRLREKLETEEIRCLSLDESHDWDAAAIGLFHLGKF